MASISKRVAAALQKEFVEGTVFRVDLDHVDVAPAGSTGILRSLPLTGDRDKIKPGDPVKILTVAGDRVALAGDMALSDAPEEIVEDVSEIVLAEKIQNWNLGSFGSEESSSTGETTEAGWIWGPWSNAPLWSGQSHATTPKTLINLSQDFGIPAGVKEVILYVAMKDTISTSAESWVCFWNTNQANTGVFFDVSGQTSGYYDRNQITVPCDADGNIYYQVNTTGSASLWVIVLGYKLPISQGSAVNHGWVHITTPLINSSWAGQLFYSTVSTATNINAYSAFGVPNGAKAIRVSVIALDNGSSTATGEVYFSLLPTGQNSSVDELMVYLHGEKNGAARMMTGVIPLDKDGNFAYKTLTSGTNTMRVWINIWGYLLGDDNGVASGWVYQEGYRANTWYNKLLSNVSTKTALNLRDEFNLPVGTSAALVRMALQDTASSTNPNLSTAFYKSATSSDAVFVCRMQGAPNSAYVEEYGVIPLDDDGNVWYTAGASGTNSLTVYLVCCGYMLPAKVERANAATVGGYTPKLSGNDSHVMTTSAYGAFQCGMGTANPAGGTNGDRFFRTDLGWEVMYWNGYWYTTQVFQAQHPWQNGIAANAQLSPQVLYGGIYAVCFVRSDMNYRVNTTNNASNYWTIVARSANLAQNSLSTYHTISTAAKAAGTIYGEEIHNAFPGVEQTSALSSRVEWYVSKTGSPGTLDIGATFYFRYMVP